MSFSALDSGGAELCSFAPVEVSGPPAAGFWASSAARATLAHMNAAIAAIANLRVMGRSLLDGFDQIADFPRWSNRASRERFPNSRQAMWGATPARQGRYAFHSH
jgi:hypothetical protein